MRVEDLREESAMTREDIVRALAAARVPTSCIREWMMDTGCGHDIVSTESIARLRQHITQAKEPKIFSTANDFTTADKTILMRIPELIDEHVSPMVMDNSPDVLTAGVRCHRRGYGFHWKPWARSPILTLPSGKKGGMSCKMLHSVPILCNY